MYYDYFGLNKAPFKITPDTSLFFPGGNRGAILEAMMYAINSGEGIVKVIGEVGSGKTMLCRMLIAELPDNVDVVYLANPSLSPDNILHAIAFELGLEVNANDERLLVMNRLQTYLLDRHAENHQVVVFVEEAQSMPIATLEEIRLLSNLETQQYKLLQIILFGQPELDHMISRKEIRQLKERITYSFNLGPLKEGEVRDYINTRMRACGYRGNDAFDKGSIRLISHYSRGLLRRVNILADKALLSAYAGNVHAVTSRHVRAAAKDSEFVVPDKRIWYWACAAGLIVLLVLAIQFLPMQQILDRDRSMGQVSMPVPAQEQPVHVEREPAQAIPKEVVEESLTRYLPEDTSRYYEYFSPGTDTEEVAGPGNTASRDNQGWRAPSPGQTTGISPAAEEPGPAEATVSSPVSGPVMPDQASGEAAIAQAFTRPDPVLTLDEQGILIRQVLKIPPESHPLRLDTSCGKCAVVIYRPLKKAENL